MKSLLFVVQRLAAVRGILLVVLVLTKLSVPACPADEDSAGTAAAAEENVAAIDLFNDHVRAVLESRCLKCHSGNDPKGALDLTRRESILGGSASGAVVDPENPAASLLLKAVRYDGLEMPPTGRIPEVEIELLARWIALGLPWPEDLPQIPVAPVRSSPVVNDAAKQFWSFRPVTRPAVPPDVGWGVTEIDRFIASRMRAEGLSPVSRADPRQLIRRASYDITGLPPTEAETEAFARDPSPAAWSAVVERLLDSPHYGEQWGRHWLDLVRYAESNSYERDGTKPHVWRYRDYVIHSFNADKPYDQFVTEQLAGDEIDQPSTDSRIATGFFRLGRWDDEPVDPELAWYDDLDDVLTTTAQTFLGLTVNCARCHDHKIDPIPQRDYYRLLSFFQNVRRYGVRSEDTVADASIISIDQPEHSGMHAAAIRRHQQELAVIDEALARSDARLLQDLSGVDVDEFQYEVNRVKLVEKRAGGLFTHDEADRYRRLTDRRSHLREHRPTGAGQALVVKEDVHSQRVSHILQRGNPHAPGEIVTPGFPAVLSPPEVTIPQQPVDTTTSGRRIVLARWITDPANPLTARVMINRIWQYHFGRGIVRTPSDFGFQGAPPTHPELLDWLAGRFIDSGWSIREIHRLIMNSAVYQLSSEPHDVSLRKDPENHLFWRFNLRRLRAEEIRDSVLWANGSLNQTAMFGPSIFTRIPEEIKAGQSRPGAGWGESPPEDQARRSIYIHVKRSLLDPVLENFDAADTDQTCPVRFTTTQPTQALVLLNSSFVLEQAQTFARMTAAVAGDSVEQQVQLALTRVLHRPPLPDEVARGVQLIHDLQQNHHLSLPQAQQCFCLLALNLNEFIYVD